MASRRIQCVRACLVAMALGTAPLSARQLPSELSAMAGPADRAAGYTATRARYEAPGRAPIELTIISKRAGANRVAAIADASKRSLATLDQWLGPLALDRLSIVDVAWNSRLAGVSRPGVVAVRSRWIAPARDRALEREVIAAMARQYWLGQPGDEVFAEGLGVYTGGKAIDTLLEGSQFYTDRHLGGFLPYAIRSIALSPAPKDARPRLRRYPELEASAPRAQRIARALEVAERYLGWPALQQALQTFRERSLTSVTELAAIASEQRGGDVSWLFEAAMREGAVFDYAVTALDSTPANGRFDVRIAIERRGDAVFARPLPLEMRFADGTTVRDQWDPALPQSSLQYVSVSPAVMAAIDPDVILILDEDRANNVMRHEAPPWNRLALKLACDWAIWLQNAVLTYSGIV